MHYIYILSICNLNQIIMCVISVIHASAVSPELQNNPLTHLERHRLVRAPGHPKSHSQLVPWWSGCGSSLQPLWYLASF